MTTNDLSGWSLDALADHAAQLIKALPDSDLSRPALDYEAVRDALADKLAESRRKRQGYRPDPDRIADQLAITLDRVGRMRASLAGAAAECADLDWTDGTAITDAPTVYLPQLVQTRNALTDLDHALALAESAATRGKRAAEEMPLRAEGST